MQPIFWCFLAFFLGRFLLPYFFSFLSISKTSGDPDRLSRSRSPFKNFVFFFKFCLVSVILALNPSLAYENHWIFHPTVQSSANLSHFACDHPTRMLQSCTIHYCLPTNPFCKILRLKSFVAQIPRFVCVSEENFLGH
jgi:hypothetical protein